MLVTDFTKQVTQSFNDVIVRMSPKYKFCHQHQWNHHNDSLTWIPDLVSFQVLFGKLSNWRLYFEFKHFFEKEYFFSLHNLKVTFSNTFLKICACRNGIQSNHWYFQRMMIQKLRFRIFLWFERVNPKLDGHGPWVMVRNRKFMRFKLT